MILLLRPGRVQPRSYSQLLFFLKRPSSGRLPRAPVFRIPHSEFRICFTLRHETLALFTPQPDFPPVAGLQCGGQLVGLSRKVENGILYRFLVHGIGHAM